MFLSLILDSISITIVDGNINICITGDTSLLLQYSLNSIFNSILNSFSVPTITLSEPSNLSFNTPKTFITGNVNHLTPFYQSFQDILNNIGYRPNIHLNPFYIYIYTHFNFNIFLGPFVMLALIIKKQVVLYISAFDKKAFFHILKFFSFAFLSIIFVLFSLNYIFYNLSHFKLEDLKGVCIMLGWSIKTPLIDTGKFMLNSLTSIKCNFSVGKLLPEKKSLNFLAKGLKTVFFNHVPDYLRDFIVRMAPKIPKGKLVNPVLITLRDARSAALVNLRNAVNGLDTTLNTLVTTLNMNNLSLWHDANAPNGIRVRHNNNGTLNGNTVEAINTIIASINRHHVNIQDRHTTLTNILIRMVQHHDNVYNQEVEDNLMARAQVLMGQYSALLN